MTSIKITYIAIYRALECIENEQENENGELSEFLDKANPYVFVDRKSADPAIYNEFQKWCEKQSIENSYEMAKEYLNKKTKFGNLFCDISEEEWNDLIEIIEKEETHN